MTSQLELTMNRGNRLIREKGRDWNTDVRDKIEAETEEIHTRTEISRLGQTQRRIERRTKEYVRKFKEEYGDF